MEPPARTRGLSRNLVRSIDHTFNANLLKEKLPTRKKKNSLKIFNVNRVLETVLFAEVCQQGLFVGSRRRGTGRQSALTMFLTNDTNQEACPSCPLCFPERKKKKKKSSIMSNAVPCGR